ncbi:MAG: hypothetical protein KBA31_14590 [Alphaproteobacteria bacterium]|nr:hypothetical protein [Alphaproteobacteria bacterium]
MFKDARARRAWRLYFLKAEAVLTPLAASVRIELIDDLKSHVRDILENETSTVDEFARLTAALDRVGSPKEFLAPLLADAVFRAPAKHGSLSMAYRTLRLNAARGTSYLMRTIGLVLTGAAGLAVGLAALNSLFRPDRAGLFLLDNDEYQLRVLGLGASSGEQVLVPWMAIALIAIGLALIAWSARRTRRMLMELIASAA